MSKISVLRDILGGFKRVGSGYSFNCPTNDPAHKGGDRDYKLSVSTTKDKFNCWVCGYSGSSMKHLLNEYGTPALANEYYKYSHHENEDYKAFCEFGMPKGLIGIDRAPRDFSVRLSRITVGAVDFYQPLYTKLFSGVPLLPLRDWLGNPHYWLIDNYKRGGVGAKYINSFGADNVPMEYPEGLFNQYGILEGLPLIIVEGWYDMASFYPYTNVEPLLGKLMRESAFTEILSLNFPIIYLFPDGNDPKAHSKMSELKQKFNDYGQKAELIEADQDPNQLLQEGRLQGAVKNSIYALGQ